MIVFHLYHRTIYTEKTETALQDQSISPGAVALGLLFGRGGPPAPPAVPGGAGGPPLPNRRPKLNLFYCYLLYSTSRCKNRSCEYLFLDKSLVYV